MVSQLAQTTPAKLSKQDVVIKRRGGGTLLDSRPIFSLDSKYVYLNCGWGVRVFSVKTGECVRNYNISSNEESVVSVFLYEDQPSAITSNGTLFSWEAKSGKTLIQRNVKLKEESVVTNAFLVPRLFKPEINDLCVLIKNGDQSSIYLNFLDFENGEWIEHPLSNTLISDVNFKHNISFGGPEEKRMIASIFSDHLNILTLDGTTSVTELHPGWERKWTCVRVHPSEYLVAAGDSTGRVVVFRNPLRNEEKMPRSVYHWHTLPCRDIAFTPAGSSFYSGGGENVLVKWNLDNPQIRNFLPRLSAEIKFIEISRNYKYVAVAKLDNSIQVLDPQSKLVCVLQELAWGILTVPGQPLFPAGLTFDPRTRALVLNGRLGHLQFYSPFNETLFYNLDITLQNYLTQERTKVIYNTEVTGVCISSNGAWMATIETREDPTARLEQRLKFWEYNCDGKSFVMNTSIENPHNGKALGLKFRPGSKNLSISHIKSLDCLLITTGSDCKFRIWSPDDIDSVYKKGVVWGCTNSLFYKQKECGPVSFSEDGTILGVGFEESLVLWDLTELKVSTSLNTPSNMKPLRFIEFGQCEAFCEIVCATEEEIFVWNLLSLNLLWKVSIKTSFLIQDPASSHFAVFTKDNTVLIFKPKSSEPVFKREHVCDKKSDICTAIFVPRTRHLPYFPTWMQDSQLYFLNSNQELLCLESESCEDLSFSITYDFGPETPFSYLLAAQTESERKPKSLKQNTGYGIIGRTAVTQLLKYPAHTMPPMSLLCGSFLQSLVEKGRQKQDEKMDIDESDEDEGVQDGSSTSWSSDEDITISEKRKKKSTKGLKGISLINEQSSGQSTAEELAQFFKDLDDDSDKFVDDLKTDLKETNCDFIIDGLE